MPQTRPPGFSPEDDKLQLYLRDIARFAPLSASAEREIAIRIHNGDSKAMETLINANLRFVVSVARNYLNQGMSLPDLVNEGNLGLIKAAARFDEKKNFKFISYAVWWIRQAILQGLVDNSRIVKVPINKVGVIHQVGKARIRLEQRLQRPPCAMEIALELNLPENTVSDILKIPSNHASLDAPRHGTEGGTFMDLLPVEEEDSDELAEKTSRRRAIESMIATLPERDSSILRLYFGIGEETCYTLAEIGKRLNITRERVRQIKDLALKKLRYFRIQQDIRFY